MALDVQTAINNNGTRHLAKTLVSGFPLPLVFHFLGMKKKIVYSYWLL